MAASRSLYDNGVFDIVVGALICLSGVIFLTDAGGLASRWNASVGRRPPAPTPEQQRLQERLMGWRHWLTVVLGLALAGFGVAHL